MLEKRATHHDISGEPGPGAVESDHRVANSLALTAALLRMELERTSDEAARSALLGAQGRISSIANFHKYLHSHGASDQVDLSRYLCDVLPEIDVGIGVRCMLALDPGASIEVSASVARSLTIIVNEFALNAYKHAYGGKAGGCVTIELGRDGDDLRLKIADGGPGLPDQFDPDKRDGLGMKIISTLIQEMGGSLSHYSDGGAHFTIRIPES